jgi:hypothetical protein
LLLEDHPLFIFFEFYDGLDPLPRFLGPLLRVIIKILFEILSSGEYDGDALFNLLLRPAVDLSKAFGIPSPCGFKLGSLFSREL